MARLAISLLLSLVVGAALYYALANKMVPEVQATPVEALLCGIAASGLVLLILDKLQTSLLKSRIAARLAELPNFEADITRRLADLESRMASADGPGNSAASHFGGLSSVLDEASANADNDKGLDSAAANVIPFEAAGRIKDAPVQARRGKSRPGNSDITEMIEMGKIEAWFQPVITLPGRKPRFLEAVPHFPETPGHEAFALKNLRSQAPLVDRQMLARSISLARKLDRDGQACTILWPVDRLTLNDRANFEAVEPTLDANAGRAHLIMPVLQWRHFRDFDADTIARLETLRGLGYQMALANCPSSGAVEGALATGMFRILMVDAELLVSDGLNWRELQKNEDFTAYSAELAATSVETEEQVMDLIDGDVLLAQGSLFSKPKRLKPELASAAKG
ncbi:MAG: EAL domain-containing protein [Rhizobiaceae bacterium]